MKFHLKNQNGNAICGAVTNRPDTFLFNVDRFKAHYSTGHKCKRCESILNKIEQRNANRNKNNPCTSTHSNVH
jgi:hypothetical protein